MSAEAGFRFTYAQLNATHFFTAELQLGYKFFTHVAPGFLYAALRLLTLANICKLI